MRRQRSFFKACEILNFNSFLLINCGHFWKRRNHTMTFYFNHSEMGGGGGVRLLDLMTRRCDFITGNKRLIYCEVDSTNSSKLFLASHIIIQHHLGNIWTNDIWRIFGYWASLKRFDKYIVNESFCIYFWI